MAADGVNRAGAARTEEAAPIQTDEGGASEAPLEKLDEAASKALSSGLSAKGLSAKMGGAAIQAQLMERLARMEGGAGAGAARAADPKTEAAAAKQASETLKKDFAERAKDPAKFHAAMQDIYGGNYDRGKVEALRQKALAGDTSWLPKNVKFADAAALGGAQAAYSPKDGGTIVLSRELVGDPKAVASAFAEEAGHHVDAMLQAPKGEFDKALAGKPGAKLADRTDAAGDEGERLAGFLGSGIVSPRDLAADGKGVVAGLGEVEFRQDIGSINAGLKGVRSFKEVPTENIDFILEDPEFPEFAKSIVDKPFGDDSFNALPETDEVVKFARQLKEIAYFAAKGDPEAKKALTKALDTIKAQAAFDPKNPSNVPGEKLFKAISELTGDGAAELKAAARPILDANAKAAAASGAKVAKGHYEALKTGSSPASFDFSAAVKRTTAAGAEIPGLETRADEAQEKLAKDVESMTKLVDDVSQRDAENGSLKKFVDSFKQKDGTNKVQDHLFEYRRQKEAAGEAFKSYKDVAQNAVKEAEGELEGAKAKLDEKNFQGLAELEQEKAKQIQAAIEETKSKIAKAVGVGVDVVATALTAGPAAAAAMVPKKVYEAVFGKFEGELEAALKDKGLEIAKDTIGDMIGKGFTAEDERKLVAINAKAEAYAEAAKKAGITGLEANVKAATAKLAKEMGKASLEADKYQSAKRQQNETIGKLAKLEEDYFAKHKNDKPPPPSTFQGLRAYNKAIGIDGEASMKATTEALSKLSQPPLDDRTLDDFEKGAAEAMRAAPQGSKDHEEAAEFLAQVRALKEYKAAQIAAQSEELARLTRHDDFKAVDRGMETAMGAVGLVTEDDIFSPDPKVVP